MTFAATAVFSADNVMGRRTVAVPIAKARKNPCRRFSLLWPAILLLCLAQGRACCKPSEAPKERRQCRDEACERHDQVLPTMVIIVTDRIDAKVVLIRKKRNRWYRNGR